MDILIDVKDLLWILDYYNGFDWALDNIVPRFKLNSKLYKIMLHMYCACTGYMLHIWSI